MQLDQTSIVKLLSQVPLFEGCTEAELGEIARTTETRDFEADAELITEGDRADREFFIIVNGKVDVTVKGRKVNELSDGDFFGEIQLLVDTPRLASVTATTPLAALVITEPSFSEVLKKIPSIAVKLVYTLAEMVAYYARQ